MSHLNAQTNSKISDRLRWVETSHKVQEQFHGLLSADPPSGRGTIANCSAADLLDENYACANYVYAPMLENIISSVVSSARENAFHGKPRSANSFESFGSGRVVDWLIGWPMFSRAKLRFSFPSITGPRRSQV